MPTPVRTLILMRHAKAESFAESDRDRDLTPRGVQDATAAGEYLRRHDLVPDHVLVSTSQRTRATWEAMEAVLGSGVTPRYDEAVYVGSSDRLLEALQETPPEARTVLFIGHQPNVGFVAHLIDDGHGDDEALHRMLQGYPTASMAVFHVEVAWEDLGEGAARLVDFRPGRD